MSIGVLIIDDDPQIRRVYEKVFDVLDRNQFDVHEAADGVNAVDILKREDIRLVLLDLRMPGLDSRKMYKIIREYALHVRIMIISVFPVATQKKIFPVADGYFDKSEGPYQLLHKLAEFFENLEIQENGCP